MSCRSYPTCNVDHDAADLGDVSGFHFARIVAIVLHQGHYRVDSLIAIFVGGHNLLVLLDYDFRKLLGLGRHLDGALDVELISFCDLILLWADVELRNREGFYKTRGPPGWIYVQTWTLPTLLSSVLAVSLL